MGYNGVYCPDGEHFLEEKLLKDNPEGIKRFVDFYQHIYYWKNNRSVEKEIIKLLKKDWNIDFTDEDCFWILAWKCGGINHQESNDTIATCKNWSSTRIEGMLCREKVCFKGVSKTINEFRNKITKESIINEKLEKEVLDLYADTLNKLSELKMHIGPTYATALLYVASRGTIPIYDQYAGRALDYITNFKLNMKSYVLTSDSNNGYADYFYYIRDIFNKEYENRYSDVESWRAVDQALWAYGHNYCIRNV